MEFSNSLLCSIGWPDKSTCKFHTIDNSTVSRTKVWVPLQHPLSTILYTNLEEEFIRVPTCLRYEKAGLISFHCARLGHSFTSCWDSTIESEPSKFRSLIATSLRLMQSIEVKKKFRGKSIGTMVKIMLSDLKSEAAVSDKQRGVRFHTYRERANRERKGAVGGTPRSISTSSYRDLLPVERVFNPSWSIDDPNRFAKKLLKKVPPVYSISQNLDVTLNPSSSLVLNLKRTRDLEIKATPEKKVGPKRNGPGPT